jgi:hypothetical protein
METNMTIQNTPRRRGPRVKRAIEEILASGTCRLSSEAPRVVPLSYPTLFRHVEAGRLRAYGKPLCVDVEHLLA